MWGSAFSLEGFRVLGFSAPGWDGWLQLFVRSSSDISIPGFGCFTSDAFGHVLLAYCQVTIRSHKALQGITSIVVVHVWTLLIYSPVQA